MTCAPIEDSDQPGHPPSLIRVFAVRMKKPWSLSTHWAHSENSDQTRRMSRLIWVFAGRTGHCVGFVVWWLKYGEGCDETMRMRRLAWAFVFRLCDKCSFYVYWLRSSYLKHPICWHIIFWHNFTVIWNLLLYRYRWKHVKICDFYML